MSGLLPNNYVLRVGVGHSPNRLAALDRALIAAGVSDYNLIKISSILPPNCSRQNDITLSKGALLPSAFSVIYSDKAGETISSATAIGIPKNSHDVGILMEHSEFSSKVETEEIVRSLALQAMKDRDIPVLEIVSIAVECRVGCSEIYCAFATVSIW
jgi:arginine decarboxylase